MTKPKKLLRTQERHYSAHHILLETARRASEKAENQEPGWSYDALVAITFSALAVEALANAFGERKVSNWADFESANPNAKLQIVAQALALNYEAEKEPWITARWLVKTRNLIAHAKPQFLRSEQLMTQAEIDKRLFDKPESKLEKEITVENAKRAVSAGMLLRDVFCNAIPAEEGFGLTTDGWSGSVSMSDDS